MWAFLLLFSCVMYSMDRQESMIISAPTNSESSSFDSSNDFASPEEKEELFTRAIYMIYPMGYDHVIQQFKPYLDVVVSQNKNQPDEDDDFKESNVNVLRRLRSGDMDERHEQYIKRLVMSATSAALDDQKRKIEEHELKVKEQEEKIEESLSKTTTALIALFSSVVASVTSVLIAVYSNK